MANPYVTGPVHVWIRFYGSSALYLGTGRNAPRFRIRRAWEGIMNDITGTQIPFDMLYEGQEAFTTVELTRWNEGTYQLLASMPDPSKFPLTGPLFDVAGDIGTLMVTENKAFQLGLVFPYASKPTFLLSPGGSMPAGYHFFNTWLESPDEFTVGTGENSKGLLFHSIKGFNPSTGAGNLGDYDISWTGTPN
jgi:hypothetical protein